jgi:hypothetical protein
MLLRLGMHVPRIRYYQNIIPEDERGSSVYETYEDEDVHGGRHTTDQTSEFEEDNTSEVDPFIRCNGEDLAKGEHKPGLCEEICRDDPCQLVKSGNRKDKKASVCDFKK